MTTKKPKTETTTSTLSTDEFPRPTPRPKGVVEKAIERQASLPKPRPGRKTVLSPEVIQTICDLLKRGNYLGTAAKYVGVAPETVSAWLRRGNDLIAEDRDDDDYDDYERLFMELSLEVEKARSFAEIKAVEVIRNAMPSQWQAAAWYLERTNNREWGKTFRAEVTGDNGGPVQVDVDSVMRKVEALTQRVVIEAEAIENE